VVPPSLVADLLFGAFSDRTTSGWGRRSPCVLAGAALTTAALPGTCPLAACHALRTTE